MAARSRRPTPEPLETDDVRLVAVGTGAWVVALVVLLPVAAGLERGGQWVWTCLFGIALGLIGIWYCRRRRVSRPRA